MLGVLIAILVILVIWVLVQSLFLLLLLGGLTQITRNLERLCRQRQGETLMYFGSESDTVH